MEKQKIDMFMMTNKECFTPQQWFFIKENLASLPEEKTIQVMMAPLKNPTTMLLIAIFLGAYGVDRFMLGDTGLGVAKLLTLGGFGIWTIIDLFSVKERTCDYNFQKFNESLMF